MCYYLFVSNDLYDAIFDIELGGPGTRGRDINPTAALTMTCDYFIRECSIFDFDGENDGRITTGSVFYTCEEFHDYASATACHAP